MSQFLNKPWSYWQNEGKWKYVLIKGAIWAAFMIPLQVFLLYYNHEGKQSPLTPIHKLLIGLGMLIIFAVLFGLWEWHYTNRKYKREQNPEKEL